MKNCSTYLKLHRLLCFPLARLSKTLSELSFKSVSSIFEAFLDVFVVIPPFKKVWRQILKYFSIDISVMMHIALKWSPNDFTIMSTWKCIYLKEEEKVEKRKGDQLGNGRPPFHRCLLFRYKNLEANICYQLKSYNINR